MRAEPRGFTLLEVLVALLLVALALAALVRTAGNEARALAMLEEATFAQWVAANVVAEQRIQPGLPASGRSNGEVAMGGRRWRWHLDVQPTELPELRRLEVQVFAAGDGREPGQPVASLTGFDGLGAP